MNEINYTSPPIVEAVINLAFKQDAAHNTDALEKYRAALGSSYPNFSPHYDVSSTVTMGDRVGASASQQPNGGRLISVDRRHFIQFRTSGFTFSRLKPYESWRTFVSEAMRVWEVYEGIIGSVVFDNVSLRYVNQIDLGHSDELADFFTLAPIFPRDLPSFERFFLQFQVPFSNDGVVNLTFARIATAEDKNRSVVLDIDAIMRMRFEDSKQDVRKHLEELRIVKNRFFESCITERTRQIFE